MTYDLNGNTLNDGTNSYVWDARNRLVSADGNGASFAYDPLGRRVSKTVMSSTTNFLYDGADAVQETGTNPTANLLTGGVDERFLRASATETDNYLTDALGSTVELTDAAGATEEQYSYGPYGMLSASGGSTTNSYAYTGREFDGLGIDYYRARYYNSTTGRFLSEDPMGFAGSGPNFYAYAADDPVLYEDPSGLETGNINELVPGPDGPPPLNTPGAAQPGGDPLQQWPLNGNLWPGFTPQDEVCTTGPLANTMNSRPCIKSCCLAHDDCYTEFHCNASSFLGGISGPCRMCNAMVVACIAAADKSTGGGKCKKCSK